MQFLNEIVQGDCLELIPKLTDKSIDLVITSPPYNVGLEGYDSFNDKMGHKNYIKWLREIFKALYPKLKKGGRVVINIGDGENGKIPTHSDIIQFMTHSLHYLQYTTIAWNKNNTSNRCLPPEELINTLDGYKHIKDVKIGDMVLTHKRRFRKVLDLHKSVFTGNKYTIHTIGGQPITVYGEHPLYVSPVLHRKSLISKFCPKGCPRKRVPLTPLWKIPIELEPYEYYLMVPRYTTQHHAGVNNFNKRLEKITGILFNYNSKELFRLIGYYLGDGSIHKNEIRLDFGPNEDYLTDDIVSIALKLGFTTHKEYRDNLKRIIISSNKILPKMLKILCGEYAHQKKMHPFLFQVPYDLQKELIKGVFHADGHFNSHQSSLVTVSEYLVYQLRDILIRLKLPPSIHKRKKLSSSILKDGRTIQGKHECYEIRLCGKYGKKLHDICDAPFDMDNRKYLYNKVKIGSYHAFYRVKEIITENVENIEVYNMEVEEDNSYLGKVLYHNCAWGSFKSPNNPSFPTAMEYILIFCKDTYELQDKGETDLTKDEFVEWSLTPWEFARAAYKESSRLINNSIHPAPFPPELPRRLIKMLSWIGSTVFDPFIGSGTTAEECKKLGRNYIGFDISEKYVDYTNKRLKHIITEKSLFLDDAD